MNTPNCSICKLPLTDKVEGWELEPGDVVWFSYYRAHTACVSPVEGGRYVVVSFRDFKQSQPMSSWGFAHQARAIETAENLADVNRSNCGFRVWDRQDRTWVATFDGRLPGRVEVAS